MWNVLWTLILSDKVRVVSEKKSQTILREPEQSEQVAQYRQKCIKY